MNKAMVVVAGALVVLALGGCATVKGVGRDITSAGEAGQKVIKGQ